MRNVLHVKKTMSIVEFGLLDNTDKIIFGMPGRGGIDITMWGTDATADNVSATSLAEPRADEGGRHYGGIMTADVN